MKKYTVLIPVYVFFILITVSGLSGSGFAADEPQTATFFCQGQAAYNPQDSATSHQQAIQDFMAQGLTQAINSFLNPSQIGTQFSELQKDILSKPARYVSSYQVFSESQTGSMLRVIGQVTVSMEALKKDLEQSGGLASGQKPREEPASSQASGASASGNGGEEGNTGEEGGKPSGQSAETVPAAAQAGGEDRGASRPATRGITTTKNEVLWAVSEKWEQDWELPTEGKGDAFLFARSLARELDGYDLSVHLPMTGSVRMDLSGSIPSSQVISLAEGLGIQDVVVGRVTYTQDRNTRQVWLDASLRVIRIDQGKSEFELHKAQSLEEVSNQDGAQELARQVAPQLVSLLGGPKTKHETASTGQGQEGSTQQAENTGPLTIQLPSAQYMCWGELERVLRQQWKNMQIVSLELGPAEGVIKLSGVSGDYISKMNGTSLPSGTTFRVDSYSADTQTMKVSFTLPAKPQAEAQ